MIIYQSDDGYFFENEDKAKNHCSDYVAIDLSKEEDVCKVLGELNQLKENIRNINDELAYIRCLLNTD